MSIWQPGPRPEWVRALNTLGDPSWIRLDEGALLDEAVRNTGLSDFGGDSFRTPLRIFLDSLAQEAQLNFVGRVLARSDILNLLENRLRMTETRQRNPEIDAVQVTRPIFITGLPRTGTSILHELLAQDPANRVPLAWEVRSPCPPPESATYETDPRIEKADLEIRFWNHVVPEYPTMHELGAKIPVECIMLTMHEFLSDQLSGTHRVPSYAAWLAQTDMRPAYAYHRQMLQLLQWRAPRERWVLKAPSHMATLDALLAVYPDARIIQTHRDPLKVMGSVASILYATAWVRSDGLDPEQVLQWFGGESCSFLLENAMRVRNSGIVDAQQFFDVRYQDLMQDPFGTIRGIYEHFGVPYSAEAEARMRAYLAAKPKDKHGAHQYAFEDTGFDLETERRRFAAYQERYRVPSEVLPAR
ncbi:MAG TPA: sulfotransferase [Candidatus Binatia bacterium]